MREKHDQVYKKCLGLQEIARDAAVIGLPKKILDQLDFSQMTKISQDLISSKYTERRVDVVWKVYWRNRPCYICLICELQSYDDHWMAVRVIEYCILIWQALIDSKEITKDMPLPLFLPIVIYNGPTPWTAKASTKELLDSDLAEDLLEYQPIQKHIVLDMLHDTIFEQFNKNWLSMVSRFEKIIVTDNLEAIFKDLKELLEVDPTRYHILFEFVKDFLSYISSKTNTQPVSLQGDDPMLLKTDFTERWNKACDQLRNEGREEGRAEGRVQGRAEGRVQGRAEGRAEGRVQGRAEGRVQGREEGIKEGTLKEKLAIAMNMLRENCNWQLINRITGLAMDKIEELAKNLKK